MGDPKQQILQWCRDRDQSAFRSFYREQSGRLWKFLVARGCERELAYDLVAEAFLRFVQNVCADPYAPVALLYRIAINLRVDAFRRERASPLVHDPAAHDAAPGGATEELEHAEIREFVADLPESEQNLVLMRYWIGLSHKEVAQALDMPEGTVRRRCTEILETLHQRLDGK